jgi:hypothetical protein
LINNDNFDWNEFEDAIHFLKSGISSLYFRDVIKAATGYEIKPFNEDSLKVITIIDNLLKNNLNHLSNFAQTNYIGRANELVHTIEDELRKNLSAIPKLKCGKPYLANGNLQSTGYPDCLIEMGKVKIYADVKTFQTKTIESTLRSFFYQPTNKSKIHFNAPHIIIGFETESLGGDNKSPFKLVGYKLIDLYELKVKFKAEFNAGNIEIYSLKKLP